MILQLRLSSSDTARLGLLTLELVMENWKEYVEASIIVLGLITLVYIILEDVSFKDKQ